MTEDIFLSIAVPTYNRAKFLDKSLNSLCKSVYKSERKDIEILILDNASSDKTSDIAKKYIDFGLVKYIKNSENTGPDNNFKKAISLSRGKYIWIFGDDDLVFDDTIKYLMRILDSSSKFGIIHLKAQNFIDKIKPVEFKEFNNFKIYDDNKAEFIKEANTNLTFITSNIVNKSLFNRIDLDAIANNNLPQLYWNIACAILSDKQVVVFDKIYAARQFNSGRYNFSEVFGTNLNDTLSAIEKNFDADFVLEIFRKRLLIYYYPANIIRIRNGLSAVRNENCFRNLYKIYKKFPSFWIFTVSAMWIPKKLGLLIVKFMQKTI